MFGGFGSLSAGVFTLLITVVINYANIEVAYVLWLCIAIGGIFFVIRYLPNSPYHQLLDQGIPHELNMKICNWLGQKNYPDVETTLRQVTSNWESWVLSYIYFVSFGGFLALKTYLPIFISEHF